MLRPLALIGFVYLAVQAVSVYFGGVFACFAAIVCLLLFGLFLWLPKIRKAKVLPVACLTAAVALGVFSVFHFIKIAPLAVLDNQDAQITGTLCELPYESNGKFYYTLRIDELAIDGTEQPPSPGKIVVTTRNALNLEPYSKLSGKVHLYQSYGEDDGFTFRQSDYAKRIYLRAYLYEYQGYSIASPASKPPYYYALSVRRAMQRSIDRQLPAEQAGILKAVLLGDKTALSESTKRDFTAVGAYHLLVVSGLHMGVIFQSLLWLLRLCRVPRRARCVVAALGVLAFMAITGFTPTVLRSGIMCLLYLGALFFQRSADALNSLGIAVLLIALANPYAAADIGFLLSVSSVLSLLLLAGPIKRSLQAKTIRLRYGQRMLRAVNSSISASVAATVGTLPLLVLVFSSVSLLAVPANLLMLFSASLLLPLAGIMALLGAVPALALMAKPFALLSGLLAKYLSGVAGLLSNIPFATLGADYPFVLLWLACTFLLLAIAILLAHRKILFRTVAVLSAILLCAGIFSYQLVNRNALRLTVLDVGQGMAVVVSNGGQTALIGCDAYSTRVVSDYLKGRGVTQLSYLQPVTEGTAEYRNLAALSSAFSTAHLLLPDEPDSASGFLNTLARAQQISYYKNKATLTLGDATTLTVYATAKGTCTVLTARGVTAVIAASVEDLTALAPILPEADLFITDALPSGTEMLAPLITVLSVDEQQLAQTIFTEQNRPVRLYATAGRGHLSFTIGQNRTLTARREA